MHKRRTVLSYDKKALFKKTKVTIRNGNAPTVM